MAPNTGNGGVRHAIGDFAPWKRIGAEAVIAAVVGVVSLVLGVVGLGITFKDLSQRWTIGGADQVLHYTIFTSGTQVWPFLPNDRLGFPEAQNLFFAPLFDPWSAIYVRLAGVLGANGILALNLYNVLSFFAVGIAAYVFLRALKLRRPVAAVFGVLIAVAPFHFFQIALGHPFIGNYWAVPLIGILTLMVASTATNPLEAWAVSGATRAMRLTRRIIPIVVLALLVGLTQSYYYVFGAIVVGGVWLLASLAKVIAQKSLKGLLWPTVTVGALFLVIATQLAILSLNLGDRYSKYFAARVPADSEIYGGKIANLLLPSPGSGFPPLARLADIYAAGSPTLTTSEAPWTAIIASIGMGLLVVGILVRMFWRTPDLPGGSPVARLLTDARFGVLSAGFLWTFLFFLSAGLGTMFAYIVSPEIRAWSRISIVLSLYAFAFVALIVHRFARGRVALAVTLAVVAVIGVVDQVPRMPTTLPLAPTSDQAIRDYAASAEKALHKDCGVVELPLKGFPETGPIGKMGDYDEGLPYVYSPTASLRWSYGAVRGTHSGDFWAGATTPATFAAAVHESGACAVQVDTTAYTTSADWRSWVDVVADADSPIVTSAGDPSRYLLFKVDK